MVHFTGHCFHKGMSPASLRTLISQNHVTHTIAVAEIKVFFCHWTTAWCPVRSSTCYVTVVNMSDQTPFWMWLIFKYCGWVVNDACIILKFNICSVVKWLIIEIVDWIPLYPYILCTNNVPTMSPSRNILDDYIHCNHCTIVSHINHYWLMDAYGCNVLRYDIMIHYSLKTKWIIFPTMSDDA